MDARDSATASPPEGVFIRVAALQSPVAVPILPGMGVEELRRSFLVAYRERVPPPSSPTITECRLVCRGKELLDSAPLEGLVRSGDHLHAIVRDIEAPHAAAAPPTQRSSQTLLPAVSTEAIRRNAQSLVEEINRMMQARSDQQQRQQQEDDDRIAVALRGRHHHGGTGAATPLRAGGAATQAALLGAGAHQQAMRLTQPPPNDNGASVAGSASGATAPVEYGGVDGVTQVQALDETLFEGRPTETVSSTTLLTSMANISEAPAMFLFGLSGGYFLGFLVILFVFARDLRSDFRLGGAVGLALNVFLGMMLPHPTVAAFRNPPH
jgi:hypothetical protein